MKKIIYNIYLIAATAMLFDCAYCQQPTSDKQGLDGQFFYNNIKAFSKKERSAELAYISEFDKPQHLISKGEILFHNIETFIEKSKKQDLKDCLLSYIEENISPIKTISNELRLSLSKLLAAESIILRGPLKYIINYAELERKYSWNISDKVN